MDRASTRRAEQGFSLIESLVALFLIGLVLAMSAPSIVTSLRQHRLTQAQRIAVNAVRAARSTAIARNKPARLVVVQSRQLRTEVLDGGSWVAAGSGATLDGGVTATVTPSAGIVFQPQGTTAAAASLALRNGAADTRGVGVSLLGVVEVSG